MKRLITVLLATACLLAVAGVSQQSARAEGNVRCGQKKQKVWGLCN